MVYTKSRTGGVQSSLAFKAAHLVFSKIEKFQNGISAANLKTVSGVSVDACVAESSSYLTQVMTAITNNIATIPA